MKLIYTFWILILLSVTSYGQNVGIGTSSPGALLDVSATNNGILIPRVALTGTGSAGPLTSPAISTMVYNTATATNVTPGYYYWSGTAWIRLIDNASIGGATTVSNTSSANTLSTTVNGVTGSTVPMVNSLSNTSSANTLSTTVNGVTGATVPMVNSISNTSSANTLSTTVNGVTGTTVPIINSNTLGLSGNTLTSTVNGVAPTQSLSGLSLSGDVTGTLAGSTVAQIQGKPVSATAPTAGQVLEYIGSTWTPTSPTLGTVTSIATTGPVTGGTITGTGTIGCATCATTTNGGALSGTSPVAVSAAGAISCATCLTTGTVSGLANPSTLIGMSVTNGSGTAAMYANAAPAINPAIVPTWTGTHTFSNATYSALFTGGYVGIGTSAPVTALHIALPAAISGGGTVSNLLVESTSGNAAFAIKSAGAANYVYQTFLQGTTGKMEIGVTASGDAAGGGVFYFNPTVQSGASGATMALKSGNVGIGNTSPTVLLEVGNGGASGKLVVITQDNNYGEIQVANPTSNGEASMGFISGATAVGVTPTSSSGTTNVWDIGASNWGIGGNKFGIGNQGYGGPILTVTSAGYVGIGTTAPVTGLHIALASAISGGGTASNLLVESTGGNAAFAIKSAGVANYVYQTFLQGTSGKMEIGVTASGDAAGGGIFYFNPTVQSGSNGATMVLKSGNVGIGTTSPTYSLQVQKTSAAAPALMIGGPYPGGPRIQTYGLDADGNAWMGLGTDMNGGPYEHAIYFPGVASSRLTFGTYNGTTYSVKATLFNNGTLGVGASSVLQPGGAAANVIQLQATDYPQFISVATNASLNNKVWRTIARSGNVFQIQSLDDAGNSEVTGVQFTRSGNSITNVLFPSGSVSITGTLSKGGGTFKIDDPLDPENKYLYHSFVESPDMMNVYNGNITTDAEGNATVALPAYFEALNTDFRYQLTCIGTFAQAIVSKKVEGNKFNIKTDKPNVEVSWQVTGVRQDKFANAHRVVPEVDKEPENKGKYLHPAEWGQPKEKGIHYYTYASDTAAGQPKTIAK